MSRYLEINDEVQCWHNGSIEKTRMQYRSHTRRVCECQLFSCSVLCDRISCLDLEVEFYIFSYRKYNFTLLIFTQ